MQAPPAPGAPAGGARSTDAISSAPLPDVVVPLSKEGAEHAGIAVVTVASLPASSGLSAPAVVEPNAYHLVAVTPLVAGRVTRVTAELGQRVQKGQIIAQIFSPELAEWQTAYIAGRAELDAHERELARTEKLVEIGSASRQELERIHAEHTSRRAGVQSAASRLQLLGLSESAIEALNPEKTLDATIGVPAPISGVVTERLANVGLNVDQASKLFTVVDLSNVWVVADVYEKDFASRPGRCARARDDTGISESGAAGPRQLYRPAGECRIADGESPDRGAERARRAAPRDVRRGRARRRPSRARVCSDSAHRGPERGRPHGRVSRTAADPW